MAAPVPHRPWCPPHPARCCSSRFVHWLKSALFFKVFLFGYYWLCSNCLLAYRYFLLRATPLTLLPHPPHITVVVSFQTRTATISACFSSKKMGKDSPLFDPCKHLSARTFLSVGTARRRRMASRLRTRTTRFSCGKRRLCPCVSLCCAALHVLIACPPLLRTAGRTPAALTTTTPRPQLLSCYVVCYKHDTSNARACHPFPISRLARTLTPFLLNLLF